MTAHPNKIIPLLLVMTALGLVSTPLAATAQTLQPQVLFNFTRDPANPQANLVQGPDGTFYGTTVGGGGGDSGTVFKMTTNGALTTLVNFTRANGASPHAGLALGGLALVWIGFYTASLPAIYPQSSFWTSSPTYFAIRVGVITTAFAVLYAAEQAVARFGVAFPALERFGRRSLDP